MKWYKSNRPNPGDTRVINKFLLFPCRIGKQIRWLERADICQMYVSGLGGCSWENVHFVYD